SVRKFNTLLSRFYLLSDGGHLPNMSINFIVNLVKRKHI
ncbi:MAG: hypothetical protein ACI9C4_001569, partial [Paraglaciecola sp.]